MNTPPTLAEDLLDWFFENNYTVILFALTGEWHGQSTRKTELIESLNNFINHALEDL